MIYEVEPPKFFSKGPEAFKGKIPFIVSDLINELDSRKAYKIEGIFRINGSDRTVKEIISKLDAGRITDFSIYPEVHDISTTLKRYFRSISCSNPLISMNDYTKMMSYLESNDPDVVDKIAEAIAQISESKRNLLGYIFKYLKKYTEYEKYNKMSTQNIAVCFATNMIPEDEKMTAELELKFRMLIEFLLNHEETMFKVLNVALCDDSDIVFKPALSSQKIEYLKRRANLRFQYQAIDFYPRWKKIRPTKPIEKELTKDEMNKFKEIFSNMDSSYAFAEYNIEEQKTDERKGKGKDSSKAKKEKAKAAKNEAQKKPVQSSSRSARGQRNTVDPLQKPNLDKITASQNEREKQPESKKQKQSEHKRDKSIDSKIEKKAESNKDKPQEPKKENQKDSKFAEKIARISVVGVPGAPLPFEKKSVERDYETPVEAPHQETEEKTTLPQSSEDNPLKDQLFVRNAPLRKRRLPTTRTTDI